jgi:hypothetical protein
MRVSEGVPCGRTVELYNPEMFQEREEVIVYTRDEFNRFYTSMQEQINYISKIYLEPSEEWKLLGYWPKIMERVHILDRNMDLLFEKDQKQSYLDAYLYNTLQNSEKKDSTSEKTIPVKLKHL